MSVHRSGRWAGTGKKLEWSDQRAIVFTEYGDTKRFLVQLLNAAIEGSRDSEERIMVFHGGMSDDQREEVQRAFNSPPEDHPVRLLVATDAAREGVNLQGHCADLFHFDIRWNPARMEQRNGRIDRTLQSEAEVRCHYFDYPQRPEDDVLRTLVRKVDVIHRELGSLGEVVMNRWSQVLDRGVDEQTEEDLVEAEQLGGLGETVGVELEAQRADLEKLRAEIDDAGAILEGSRQVMEFEPALLLDALDVALELAGGERLASVGNGENEGSAAADRVPELPDSWQPTLDHLRPSRARDEMFWEWRRREPQPVVFEPPPKMNSALVQLHLQHPFVRRLMSRFLAQGTSAHDLSRVTVVRTSRDHIARVIAFGRLSLFGPGATRLHDQLVSDAAEPSTGNRPRKLRQALGIPQARRVCRVAWGLEP